ncbi:MAG: PKD domain-containing protein [Candidatus Peregrinibacteria bacterium]
MAEEPKKTTDIEMGEEEQDITPPASPKINNYMKDVKESGSNPVQPEVKPSAPAPAPTPTPAPVSQGRTIGQVKAGMQMPDSQMPQSSPKGPIPPIPPGTQAKTSVPNPAAKRKAVLGCLGAFGVIVILYILFAFIFISQTGGEANPIAKLLGVNQTSFVNGLITSIHIVFILVSLVAFTFTMIGLFRASMAKKEDRLAKKAGLKMSLIAGISLIFILITWMFVYVYLDAKRVQSAPQLKEPIITEPEETLNLTAPIEIKFDASNVPVDKNKFQIISYEWDFGDGEVGTSQIVAHRYEKKGRFDVLLTVTRRNKTTGEEFEDQYSSIVSIANQALTAVISADPQSGGAPLKVELDASESVDPDGTIDNYEWDLNEDGQYDDEEGAKITHTFDKIGRYTVGLRVVSTTGEFAVTEKEIVVEEEKLPTAVITVVDEPKTYVIGLNYVFKADKVTSPNGTVEKYEWNFNDGTKTENTQTVSHSFSKEGTYEITLKLTDEKDMEGEITKVITVGAQKGKPVAAFKVEPGLTGTVPFAVNLDASATTDNDNNIVDYRWDFENDGTIDEYGETVSHSYTTEGTYTVELTVVDADENTSTATQIIKVEAQGIVAIIKADKIEGNVPVTVKFDASGSTYDKGQITTYKWDFGDGTAPKLGTAEISHKYTEIGTYTAKVTAIGADNSQAEDSVIITVREIPLQACFSAVFDNGPAPLADTFDPGCSTGTIATYFWDFDDGGTSTQVKPNHTFTNPGTYTVTLEISDSENTVSSASLEITVTE